MRVGPFSAGRFIARLMLGSATLLLVTLAAHADSTSTYSVSGSSSSNSALSGNFTIDTTTNTIQNVNIMAGTENLTVVESLSYSNGTYSGTLGPQTASFSVSGGAFSLDTASQQYQGTIAPSSTGATSAATSSSASSSTSTNPAPTPEPCSILLLLTGLGSITALARRRSQTKQEPPTAGNCAAALLNA